MLAEYNGADDLLSQYIYANGQRIAKLTPAGQADIYLSDHLSSARALTRSRWSANYYPFGEVASQTGSEVDTRFDFTGHERDPGTGLIYAGQHYYHDAIGRWLSVDPFSHSFPSLTPYHYVRNNPLNRIDPDGRIDWPLKGNTAVNKRDYADGAWGLSNKVVRTSTYLDTERPPGASNPHIGVDYRASEGTPFYSLGDGTVVEIGETSKGAKFITVEYEGGDEVRFLHISKTSEGLKAGDRIYEGQVLGETGSTGTTHAHLHVDAKDRTGKRIDPEAKNYGTVSNRTFFEVFDGDYKNLKAFKNAMRPVNAKVDNTKVVTQILVEDEQ